MITQARFKPFSKRKEKQMNPNKKTHSFFFQGTLLFAVIPAGIAACGTAEDQLDEAVSAFTPQARATSEEQTASQLQDVVEALETVDASAVFLALLDEEAAPPERTCTVNTDGTVTVEQTKEKQNSVEKEGRNLNRVMSRTMTMKFVNIWTPAEGQGSLECNSGGQLSLDWRSPSAVNGLQLASTVNHSRQGTVVTQGTLPNGTEINMNLSRTDTAQGSREITHSDHELSDTGFAFVRTISSQVTRTMSGTRRDPEGDRFATEEFSITHANSTDPENPLKVRTVWSLSEQKWTSKTVQSGTIISTNSEEGNRIVSQLSGVEFENGNCIPISGQVQGEVFALDSDDENAQSSFVILFGQDTESTVSISYDGAESEDFPTVEEYLEGCVFQRAVR